MCSCGRWGAGMSKVVRILWFTLCDLMHNRSFYVLLIVGFLLVLVLRGCMGGSYTANRQQVDELTVAWHVSKVAFHIIAGISLLFAALLAMGLLHNDRQDGTTAMILSRPVRRSEYLFGRLLGVWVVSSLLMLVLHGAIYVITYLKIGGRMPMYFPASLGCTVNLLFMTFAVALLARFMPGFVAALVGVIVAGVSLFSDMAQRVLHSELIKQAAPDLEVPLSWWRAAWPKLFALQYWAASLIGEESPADIWGPLHPLANVLLYAAAAAAVLQWRFGREEVQ